MVTEFQTPILTFRRASGPWSLALRDVGLADESFVRFRRVGEESEQYVTE